MANRRIFYLSQGQALVYVDAPDTLSPTAEWSSADNGDGTYTVRQRVELSGGGYLFLDQIHGAQLNTLDQVIGVRAYSGTYTSTVIGRVAIVTGDSQSVAVGVTTAALQVVVEAVNGDPLVNVPVAWTTDGEGEFTGEEAKTDLSGNASVTYTPFEVGGGSHTLTATIGTFSLEFSLTVTAGAAHLIVLLDGDGQTGAASGALAAPFRVQVTDPGGNPVAGETVGWAVTAGGGSLSGGTSNTDANGIAGITLTLGSSAGTNTVTATLAGASGSPVTFTASGVSATAASMSITSGASQTGVVAGAAAAAIVVTVLDAASSPVQGFTVTADGGAGGSFASTSVATDALGKATFTFTTPTAVGTSNLIFRDPAGVLADLNTTVATVASAATKLALRVQPGSTATSGNPLNPQPEVELQDANSNPKASSGVTVTASIGTGTASLAGDVTVVTDAQGRAAFTDLQLSGTGDNTLDFDASGLTGVRSQTIALGGAIASQLLITREPVDVNVGGVVIVDVTIADSSGSRVTTSTAPVTATLSAGANLGGTAVVNAVSGIASFADLTVDAVGDYTLTFSSPGLAADISVTFTVSAVSSSYPNEPVGYVDAGSAQGYTAGGNPFDVKPPASPAPRDQYGWRHFNTIANVSVVTDAAGPGDPAPQSPSNVLQIRWPTTLNGGGAPCHEDFEFPPNTLNVYIAFRVWIDPNWTNGGNTGTKFAFFRFESGSGLGHYINFVKGATGTGPMFSVNLQDGGPGPNRNMYSSIALGVVGSANRGRWLFVEVLAQANSIAGTADGVAKVWVDGVQVLSETDVMWFPSGTTRRFVGIAINPTYGGGSNSPPADLFCFIDHFYSSTG